MSGKILVGFVVLVLLPVGVLGWLGVRVSYKDRQQVQQQIHKMLHERLLLSRGQIDRSLRGLERRLLKQSGKKPPSVSLLRALARREPLIRQAFWLTPRGRLRYPHPRASLSQSERQFLRRTRAIWEGRALLSTPRRRQNLAESQQATTPKKRRRRDSLLGLPQKGSQGWISWYWEEGLHLLFWRRTSQGHLLGFEIDRVVLMAQLIGELPDSSSKPSPPARKGPPSSSTIPGLSTVPGLSSSTPSSLPVTRGRIVLRDGRGSPIYQWGLYQPSPQERPLARLRLGYPLQSWSLAYLGPESKEMAALSGRITLNLALMVSAVCLALIGVAFFLFREYSRDMREAAQRVTFVTQVSHELKTPLTNIRLYAELLEGRLPEEEPRLQRYVQVIVTESQRLSRLINNILTFSRQRRNKLKLHLSPLEVDPFLAGIVEQFQPSFQTNGVAVSLQTKAPLPTYADPDALEQIICNLLSNVEKYAASGEYVEIRSEQNVLPERSNEGVERKEKPQKGAEQIEGEERGRERAKGAEEVQENSTEGGEKAKRLSHRATEGGSDLAVTRIIVSDWGPGIPSALKEKLFLPFVRGSHLLSDGVTGTGIGLTIARELARKMGGDLSLVPSKEGACFVLTLPLEPGPSPTHSRSQNCEGPCC